MSEKSDRNKTEDEIFKTKHHIEIKFSTYIAKIPNYDGICCEKKTHAQTQIENEKVVYRRFQDENSYFISNTIYASVLCSGGVRQVLETHTHTHTHRLTTWMMLNKHQANEICVLDHDNCRNLFNLCLSRSICLLLRLPCLIFLHSRLKWHWVCCSVSFVVISSLHSHSHTIEFASVVDLYHQQAQRIQLPVW